MTLKFLLYTWAGEEFLKSVCGLTIVTLAVLSGSIEIMAKCRKVLETKNNLEVRVIAMYKELQIWNDYVNQNFCYFALPPLIFFGVSVFIFANYGTIRLPGKLPLIAYWACPATSLIGIFALWTILPLAVMVWETSRSHLDYLRGRCYSKYEVRLLRSVRNVGFAIGPFGHATKSWMVAIMGNVVDYTTSALLTF